VDAHLVLQEVERSVNSEIEAKPGRFAARESVFQAPGGPPPVWLGHED
jgi:hypothetical protein